MAAVGTSPRPFTLLTLAALAGFSVLITTPATAQQSNGRHRLIPHLRAVPPVAGRVLTVHRRVPRYAAVRGTGAGLYGEGYYGPALLRRWNDPNLYSFGGWRFGGDAFYGDTRGDPITRGNATLGAISGYGGARGGYGGPHFDSVGGFHNGPGPDAGEAAAYASGSISTPVYDRPMPNYPSIKARVAALNTGVVQSMTSARFQGTSFPEAAPSSTRIVTPRYLRSDDFFPDIGIDAF